MNTKQIVAEVIYIFNTEKDELLRLLKIFEIIKSNDSTKIIEIYSQVKSGIIKSVNVTTSINLKTEQKDSLEKKLNEKLNMDAIFTYKINKDIRNGLEIKVGDSVISSDINWY